MNVHDDTVPFHVQEHVYNFIYGSSFKIKGWKDRDDIAKTRYVFGVVVR